MQCPRCEFENTDRKTYCDQCGTLLTNSTSNSSEMEYGIQSQTFSYEKLSPHPRFPGFRIFRSIVYFIGVFIAAFGLIGTINALFPDSPRFEGLAIFFGLGLLVGGIVIFFLLLRRAPQLRQQYYMVGIVGTIVGALMAFALATALDANGKLSFFSVGCIIMLFGFAWAAFSLW